MDQRRRQFNRRQQNYQSNQKKSDNKQNISFNKNYQFPPHTDYGKFQLEQNRIQQLGQYQIEINNNKSVSKTTKLKKCPECDKSFRRDRFVRHIRAVHGEEFMGSVYKCLKYQK